MFNENDLRHEITRVKNSKDWIKNELKDDFFKNLSEVLAREPDSVKKALVNRELLIEQVIAICKQKLEFHRNSLSDMIAFFSLIISMMAVITTLFATIITPSAIESINTFLVLITIFFIFVMIASLIVLSLERKKQRYRSRYILIISFFESFK